MTIFFIILGVVLFIAWYCLVLRILGESWRNAGLPITSGDTWLFTFAAVFFAVCFPIGIFLGLITLFEEDKRNPAKITRKSPLHKIIGD